MAKYSILGLAPKKLAHLLGITFDSGKERESDSKQNIEQMLADRLASPLSPDIAMLSDVSVESGRKDDDVEQHSATPLGDVLTARETDLGTIMKIRRYAKKMTAGKGPEAEHVAVTIYFAAIANALLFHDAKITSYSYKALEISFNKLIKKRWMPRRLRRLFVDAAGACRNKTLQTNSG